MDISSHNAYQPEETWTDRRENAPATIHGLRNNYDSIKSQVEALACV